MSYRGFMILQKDLKPNYGGVERILFEPTISDDFILKEKIVFSEISELYPEGWKKQAYKIYELNRVRHEDIDLVNDFESAKSILDILHANSKDAYEAVYVEIFPLASLANRNKNLSDFFLGIDIAYLGGDYYSAIKNGLLNNPNLELQQSFNRHLNQHHLFTDIRLAEQYVKRFKEVAISESKSDFWLYMIYRATPGVPSGPN